MNQVNSIQTRNRLFWWVAGAIILFLYIPLFIGEYNIRQDQISRGVRPEDALPVLGSDSMEYALLSKNLAEHHVFSLDLKKPETFRTIGYPAFVSLYLARGLPLATFPLMQILLALLTSWGIFLIGKKFWKPSVGIAAAALYLLDPVTIITTFTILTDVFYVFLLIFAIYFFFASTLDEKWKWTIGGLFLGLSTLVRPISMFLLIVLFVMYIIQTYKKKQPLKQTVVPIVLCLSVYALVVMPWVIRNKQATGVYGISTVKSYNLYHYYVPEFLAYKNKISPEDARVIVGEGLGTFDERSLANASKMEARAKEFILKDPLGYGTFHIFKTIPFFLSSGLETLYTGYNDASGTEHFSTIKENLTGLLLSGKIGQVVSLVREHKTIGAEQIILLCLWLLAALSVFAGYKRKELFHVLFLWILILYFAILTGPVAYSRYRLPATPFLFLLATYHVMGRFYKGSSEKSEVNS